MEILIFFVTHWYASLFFQTTFYHRYAAHGMFTMSERVEQIFVFLGYVAQGSSYLSPKTYAILHRMHHMYADTPDDVHSPTHIDGSWWKRKFGFIWMMRETALIYYFIDKGRSYFTVNVIRPRNVSIPPGMYKNLPNYPFLDWFGQSWFSRLVWGSGYVAFYVSYASSPWLYLLLPIHFLMGPVHGVIINWSTHIYGYRNYQQKDTSTNLPIPMLGEALHNNHHGEPANPNFARRWWEIDMAYQILRILHAAKIIQLKTR